MAKEKHDVSPGPRPDDSETRISGPKWRDACDHGSNKYLGTYKRRDAVIDVYWVGRRGCPLCVRYGSDPADYYSFSAEFVSDLLAKFVLGLIHGDKNLLFGRIGTTLDEAGRKWH